MLKLWCPTFCFLKAATAFKMQLGSGQCYTVWDVNLSSGMSLSLFLSPSLCVCVCLLVSHRWRWEQTRSRRRAGIWSTWRLRWTWKWMWRYVPLSPDAPVVSCSCHSSVSLTPCRPANTGHRKHSSPYLKNLPYLSLSPQICMTVHMPRSALPHIF